MHGPAGLGMAVGGVPGVGVWWVGGGRAIPGTHQTSQDPYLVIFSLRKPTHGQMKAILRFIYEVSQI